jgi:hypothetical protein
MKTYIRVPLTAKDYRRYALKSLESILERVNKAHDRVMKQRTSSNIMDKINEENELFELQTLLYNYRARLQEK